MIPNKIINNILGNEEDDGYLVITRDDGEYFDYYDKNSKHNFYTHFTKSYDSALQSKERFRKKGVYAKIQKNFIENYKKFLKEKGKNV